MGRVYEGKVVKIADLGAFVNFMPSKDGLVHISELAPHRVEKTTDVVKEGDTVKVLVIGFDERGKIKLSLKRVDQQTGTPIDLPPPAERAPRGDRGDRGDRGGRDRDRGGRGGRDRDRDRGRREAG